MGRVLSGARPAGLPVSQRSQWLAMLDREFTLQHLCTAGRFYPAQLPPLPPRP